MPYQVASEGRVTTHRTKPGAIKEYFKRFHKGDREIIMVDTKTGATVRRYSAKTVSPARIPNGRMVPARIKHKGKTYPGKVKRVGGKVRIFVTPNVAKKINPHSAKPKLTPEQKKALAAYNFALQQEDRYLGSVFVTPTGQRRVEAVTKEAYDRCKRLGMDHTHGL